MEADQHKLECHTNVHGHRQYFDENDRDVCPNCLRSYTNVGNGVLCDECDEEE